MTRVLDTAEAFVQDALAGFVAVHGDLVRRVDGGVVRAEPLPPGRTAVVVGGGSGHYPAFAGVVGAGLAAGAVCGNIFTSPSAGQAYRVARAADAGGGVLFSYGNYAGDVLHFGAAQERLRAEGIDTRTVLCTDDIASAPADRIADRRGIAGDFVVFKVAGAAAERGDSLDEVERLAIAANDRTRTLGVAFGGCTFPGADGPLFTVPDGMMSVGLGIHGEPGIRDVPMGSAAEIAEILVSELLADVPEDRGDRVAVLVNGLGTVKYEELFVLYGQVARPARRRGSDCRRAGVRRAGDEPGHGRRLGDAVLAHRRSSRSSGGLPRTRPRTARGWSSGTPPPAGRRRTRRRERRPDVGRLRTASRPPRPRRSRGPTARWCCWPRRRRRSTSTRTSWAGSTR